MNKLKAIATSLLASFLALSATAQLSNRSYEASFGDPTEIKGKEKIQMSRSFISDKDRACYTINSQYKYRPELVTLWCATLPFCFAGYFLYAFGRKNAFNETYILGRMTFNHLTFLYTNNVKSTLR